MVDDKDIALMTLQSRSRIMRFSDIATQLGIPLDEVEATLIKAIANGTIQGRTDTEHQHVIVDDTLLVSPTPELVKSTLEGLKKMESGIDADIYSSSRAHKRSRSAL